MLAQTRFVKYVICKFGYIFSSVGCVLAFSEPAELCTTAPPHTSPQRHFPHAAVFPTRNRSGAAPRTCAPPTPPRKAPAALNGPRQEPLPETHDALVRAQAHHRHQRKKHPNSSAAYTENSASSLTHRMPRALLATSCQLRVCVSLT